MAVYDGFFDARFDEETGEFDRSYNAGEFVDYFGSITGSGVCVYENPDSMKVTLENSTALVAPGYLFIRGFWLANKAGEGEDPAKYRGYAISLPASGTVAIVARLSMARRMIDLLAVPYTEDTADADTLVLSVIDMDKGTAADTRSDSGLCGTVDSAGALAGKVAYVIDYIDNQIENKLEEVEKSLGQQSALLDQKISLVEGEVEKLAPPPVGTVKFSASENVGPEWLKCDGSFVNEADYPQLVAALGKLIPSGDKLQLLSSGEIGQQITNGVVYNGRMWVYSYSAQKLYGVDLEGRQSIKEIPVSSSDSGFGQFLAPSTQHPLALSITPSLSGGNAKIFLAQVLASDRYISSGGDWKSMMLLYTADFSGNEASLSMQLPFQSVTISTTWAFESQTSVPYVVSFLSGGQEWFYCATRGVYGRSQLEGVKWQAGGTGAQNISGNASNSSDSHDYDTQRIAFNQKNQKEAVSVIVYYVNAQGIYTRIASTPNEVFTREGFHSSPWKGGAEVANPLNVVGSNKVLIKFTTEEIIAVSLTSGDQSLVKVTNVTLPSSARIFVDGSAYLWGKDIYMFFVGSGILFSRTLEEGSFGYLDTTSIMGTITQFGYLDYSSDENTLYLLGQDTANRVKVAKIELNTLYDYANDGAWLPMIASDGVPAWIKAKEPEEAAESGEAPA